ncbi:MAG: alpha/beta fold hydrolase [Oscillospiraceae bacterium]
MYPKIIIFLLAIFICFFLVSCSEKQVSESDSSVISTTIDIVGETKQILAKIKSENFAEVYALCNESVKNQISEEQIKQGYESIVSSMGEIKSEVASSNLNNVGIITLEMEDGSLLDFTVTFDKESKIAGLVFSKSQLTIPEAPLPDTVTETSVTITTQEYNLPALLTIPKNATQDLPAVVLVHGSGANDKNETIGGSAIFRDLAHGLAKEGIAVLRYDKRTLIYGDELDPETITLKEETIDDAVSAVTLLENTKGIDKEKIYVLGHSLGAMAIPLIAQENENISGFIALSAPARKLEDLILEQSKYLLSLEQFDQEQSELILENYEKQIKSIKSLTKNSTLTSNQLLGMSKNYWLFLNEYDQVKMADKITKPILFLQGERDYQVTMQDFTTYQSALKKNKNAVFISYANLNHLFIEGSEKSTPDEYMEVGQIDEKVISDITAFIKQ